MGTIEDIIPENLKAGAVPQTSNGDETRIKCMADYRVIKEVGEGSFSVVYAALEKAEPCREVAIKMCMKKQIIKLKRVDAVHREKEALARLSTKENRNPFIMVLYATFQDNEHLYFVTSYAKHGDLLHVMLQRPEKRFSLTETVFYASELLHALQHLHSLSILHRDVKPENVLVAASGHILLSDFGVVKDFTAAVRPAQATTGRVRRSSFVGTAQYVSPEILEGQAQSTATDLWSFGVVVFQLLSGRHCFHDESEYLIFKRIQKLLYKFPDDFSENTRNLIEKLLVVEPEKRLGTVETGGPESLRRHPFFEKVDWDNLEKVEPPTI